MAIIVDIHCLISYFLSSFPILPSMIRVTGVQSNIITNVWVDGSEMEQIEIFVKKVIPEVKEKVMKS